MTNLINHPYHLVEKRPWPLEASTTAFLLTLGLTKIFHQINYNLIILAIISLTLSTIQWWRDITRESTFQGLHTIKVITGLKWGIILFIISEIIFFFSFFWAFFHRRLNPTIDLGGVWPPTRVYPFNPFQIPLLNTAILLASGVSVTWSHHSLLENNLTQATQSLSLTILLGLYFTIIQAIEYIQASFSIADSVYGRTFFIATGFHGLHVIIGSTFLIVTIARLTTSHFSRKHHFGIEAAIWYWHFVDVVWLFLFTSIYWWGS